MNIIRASRAENAVCEQQARFIQERISMVETNFSELCSAFSLYTRKSARLRDSSDELSKVLQTYSENETINKSLKQGLFNFANTLGYVGDYRDMQVEYLDKNVVQELSHYDTACRNVKDEIKNIYTTREREMSRRRNLDRIKERNPRNRQQITIAETELMKATAELARNQKALEEQMDLFEKKKLHDIKAIMLEFVKMELAFHSKAVEFFTKAYKDVAQINEEYDLEEFREVLKGPETASRLDTVKRTSFRSSSLQSLANLFTAKSTSSAALSEPPKTAGNPQEQDAQPQTEIIRLREDTEEESSSSSIVSQDETPKISFRK